MATRHLNLDDIIQAFAELGGEAEWKDVEARIIAKRHNTFAPYKNRRNYRNTMFQFVQQHCERYRKFRGDIRFLKLRGGRFRLAASSDATAMPRALAPEDIYPETVLEEQKYITGAVRQVLVNAYERDPEARAECIRHHGTRCSVCAVSFEERYGQIGKGFIHVHHRKPLASREIYTLDPVRDLIPVCPNCHSMLHSHQPPLSVEQLKAFLAREKRKA